MISLLSVVITIIYIISTCSFQKEQKYQTGNIPIITEQQVHSQTLLTIHGPTIVLANIHVHIIT